MRLLTPAQHRDASGEELTRDLLRLQEVTKALAQANQQLADADDAFHAHMTAQSAEWELAERHFQDKAKALYAEVESLEARRKRALVPLEVEQARIDASRAEADALLATAQAAMTDADTLRERLEDKLDAIGEREETVLAREERVVTRERGIAEQADMTRAAAEALQEQVSGFRAHMLGAEANLSERTRKIRLTEISQEARWGSIAQREEALRIAEIQVADQRATLERERLRNPQWPTTSTPTTTPSS